jgi:hypothetical protein
MMSVRWGVPVKFKPGETLVWLPNNTFNNTKIIIHLLGLAPAAYLAASDNGA